LSSQEESQSQVAVKFTKINARDLALKILTYSRNMMKIANISTSQNPEEVTADLIIYRTETQQIPAEIEEEFIGEYVQSSKRPFSCEQCGLDVTFHAKCPICNADIHWSLEAVRIHFENNLDKEHVVYSPFRELPLFELGQILESTIKRDVETKIIAFLNMILAQTNEEQFTVIFTGSSSSGKSYIPEELAAYFPENEVWTIAGASPKALFYEKGRRVIEQDGKFVNINDVLKPYEAELAAFQSIKSNERTDEQRETIAKLKAKIRSIRASSKILVDCSNKIMIFVDQPNTVLLANIRPFLSHDRKYLEFSFVNKGAHGANVTEHIILVGFSSVFFATVAFTPEEQETTRVIQVSPETNSVKIAESLYLLAEKKADREKFLELLNERLDRRSLRFRIELLRTLGVRAVLNSQHETITTAFIKQHKHLIPRLTRDLDRLISLAYGKAILNSFNRKLHPNRTDKAIELEPCDIIEAMLVYEPIKEANELGVSPEIFQIFENTIKPAYKEKNAAKIEKNKKIREENEQLQLEGRYREIQSLEPLVGVTLREIQDYFRRQFGRIISSKRLRQDILEKLILAGLVGEEVNPEDRRIKTYFPILGYS
jgi:hypothetical protein